MKKQEEEVYTGESEKLVEFNKRITIYRTDAEGKRTPYLKRWTLFSLGKLFSIKIHEVIQSDDICSHDHPWGFITFLLSGGYYEWTPILGEGKGKVCGITQSPSGHTEVRRWYNKGSLLYRPATWQHRLELKEEDQLIVHEDYYGARSISYKKILIPAKTLVFTGRVVREWGFFTKSGWIFWETYKKEKYC